MVIVAAGLAAIGTLVGMFVRDMFYTRTAVESSPGYGRES